MKFINLLILCLLPFMLLAQYKSEYDVDKPFLAKSSSQKAASTYSDVSNQELSVSMLSGGYFTVGTTNGKSASILDNNCDISFGHPYAKTSYPVVFIDGMPYKLDDLFPYGCNIYSSPAGDTLSISASDDKLKIVFSTILQPDNSLLLALQITNLDSLEHPLGAGLIFDPALGKWGDGYAKIGDQDIDKQNSWFTSSFDHLTINEKRSDVKGLAVDLYYPHNDGDQLHLLNWNLTKEFNPFATNLIDPEQLYDLTLFYNTGAKNLKNGESIYREIELRLADPDFSSPLFARWDMPQFLTLNNGLVFPNNVNATLEVYNTTDQNVVVMNTGVETPPYVNLTPATNSFTVAPNSYSYAKVNIKTSIIYENKIADVALWLDGDTETLDLVSRSMFIPQTPVSDTGITIEEDSLITSNYPEVGIVFAAKVNETGKRILDLTEENIFLYENQSRINEFSIEPFGDEKAGLIDVVFVLDISGSMGGEIRAVANNLNEFGAALASSGYDYKIGVITFSTTVDNVWDLTSDLEDIKNKLNAISLWGGEEDSPSALIAGSNLSLRPGSKRTIIWITDEAYPEYNYTKQQVVTRMLEMGITVHGVGLNELQTDWFDPIVIPTGGNFYDINGNFRDILLDISNTNAIDRFLLKYISNNQSALKQISLKIRYAGLGGEENYEYTTTPLSSGTKNMFSFFPNPFNPSITFSVNIQNYKTGSIRIFNILGQLVKSFDVSDMSTPKIIWNAVNDYGQLVGTGFYLVQLTLSDYKGKHYTETAKILYLK